MSKTDILPSTSSPVEPSKGSTILGASLNFVNCIVGAGCIGYGGAIAQSGGMISLTTMLLFAILAKLSFDLLIGLSIETGSITTSYEDLGEMAWGRKGRLSVLWSKLVFSYGALVAIAVIVKDNFAPACRMLLGLPGLSQDDQVRDWTLIFYKDNLLTFLLCLSAMLPICFLRDMHPLERFSAIKIMAFAMIITTVIYLFLTLRIEPTPGQLPTNPNKAFVTHWLEVRPGFIQNMGTYIFTFVAQHTCHLVYRSLKPELRNLDGWKKVSTYGLAMSTVLSLPVGLFAYLTYWEQTDSNLFLFYPPSFPLYISRLLLCVAMLLSYPMPFFSTRELIIIALPKPSKMALMLRKTSGYGRETDSLLKINHNTGQEIASTSWMIPGEDRQLTRPYHAALTVLLWGTSIFLALAAPSLGDVLNLMGCLTGTIIAFILPALFSFQIHGYTHVAAILLAIGSVVGCIGTYYSVADLVHDLQKRN